MLTLCTDFVLFSWESVIHKIGPVSELAMSPPKGANGAATKAKPAKKLKDGAAPKRPITAYIAFASAARAEVQEELGTRSVPEVARELGRRWVLLHADARAPYEQESKRAKERFEEEMRSYTPSDEFLARKAAGEK